MFNKKGKLAFSRMRPIILSKRSSIAPLFLQTILQRYCAWLLESLESRKVKGICGLGVIKCSLTLAKVFDPLLKERESMHV